MQNLIAKFTKRYLHDFNIAVDSLLDNKLKSILTALGIIFGVAAVISMLAIGRGAKQEILEQIKLVGVNNIVISPIVQAEDEENSTQNNDEKEKRKYSPGLTMSDIWSIRNQVKTVENISPEISMNSFVVQNGIRESAKIVGVSANYFDIYNLMLESGKVFTAYQEKNGLPVCIIGANIRSKFFSKIDPLDQYIKFGSVWLKVIGVIEKSNISLTGFENAGVNVFNDNIYIPAKTMLLRFQNRALFTSGKLKGEARDHLGRSIIPSENVSSNYHQLDKIIVQVTSSEMMAPTAEILSRLMFRKHLEVKDYEIRLPELELKQEQRTKDIFNVGCRRYRYHEYHVCISDGTDKRNRHKIGNRS
jgi:putative ABC transport system permease protein